ncbi:MAG: transposase [Phycisphaerae bacterium]|nr:transposase [Phycisphaerae bacterium]
MSTNRKRRKWTPEQKLRIVIESLQSERKTAEICRREGLSPNQMYDWRKKLLGSAQAVFAAKDRNDSSRGPRIDTLIRRSELSHFERNKSLASVAWYYFNEAAPI